MMTFEDYKKTEESKKILAKLKRKLTIRGFDISNFEDDDLYDEIEEAIEQINNRRHFVSTDEKLFEDKYKEKVIRLSICSIAKMGAEGEQSHSENGVSRSYEKVSDILSEIVPLGRIIEL